MSINQSIMEKTDHSMMSRSTERGTDILVLKYRSIVFFLCTCKFTLFFYLTLTIIATTYNMTIQYISSYTRLVGFIFYFSTNKGPTNYYFFVPLSCSLNKNIMALWKLLLLYKKDDKKGIQSIKCLTWAWPNRLPTIPDPSVRFYKSSSHISHRVDNMSFLVGNVINCIAGYLFMFH